MPQKRRKLSNKTSKTEVAKPPPLPQCEGPKLDPFIDYKSGITFLRLLSDPHPDAQAFVFEVLIGGKSYALKAVRVLS